MINYKLLFTFSCCISVFCYSQRNYENRAMYIDNFATILSSNSLEEELLNFSKEHKINTLILYDLNKINKRFHLGDSTKNHLLANFIRKAKTDYGIKKISASGESGSFFFRSDTPL